MDVLQQISDFISGNIGTMSLVLGVILEIVFRFVNSTKVRSIFRIVSSILSLVSRIFSAIAGLIDGVVPDKTPV